jgi:universal stress protein E
MDGIARIIAGVDPHADSRAASRLGARLAAALGTPLELFAPVYNSQITLAHFETRESLQHARDTLVRRQHERLESIIEELGFDGPAEVLARWDHPPEEALTRRTLERPASLLVVALPEVDDTGRAPLSSSLWQLVRHCPAPLLLTRGRAWRAAPVVVAAVDPTGRHGRRDDLDVAILKLAERLAAGGTLHAFHAWERTLRGLVGRREEARASDMPEGALEHRQREAVYAALGAAGVAPARVFFVEGPADKTLPAYCTEQKADLVVMGAIARNPFGRIFIGSTAERVLGQLPCDMLVVKPDTFRTPVTRERWPREDASAPVLGVPGI